MFFSPWRLLAKPPSGASRQPWRFLVITDREIKRRIREVCEQAEREFYSRVEGELREWLLARGLSWRKPFLEEAPIMVLVISETKAPYSTQSVWLTIGYVLLALEELGLGTVTYTPSTVEGVMDEFGIPKGFRLEAILPVGFPADEKPKEPRLTLGQVAFLNSWGNSVGKGMAV